MGEEGLRQCPVKIEDRVQHMFAYNAIHWMPISREGRDGPGQTGACQFLEKWINLQMVPNDNVKSFVKYWPLDDERCV